MSGPCTSRKHMKRRIYGVKTTPMRKMPIKIMPSGSRRRRTEILPDDAPRIEAALRRAVADGFDAVFTLGGTGIGPRDVAPEVVSAVCEKTIPGIMENIRVKFGADKPSALLSRSVAGTLWTSQLYALPGSVKAVTEYLGEIFKTLEHAVCMLHGLDVH